MTLSVARQYDIEIVSHPTKGAQEWLGNTQHMFTELLTDLAERADTWFSDGELVLGEDGRVPFELWLYRDPEGDRSPSGTYWWSPRIDLKKGVSRKFKTEELYGPVYAEVTISRNQPIVTDGFYQLALDVEPVRKPEEY